MIEKFTDEKGVVWFKNDYLPQFPYPYISARMIINGCRYGHVSLQPFLMKLPPEICKAVRDEEKKMFNCLKMPVGKVPPISDEDLV